MFWLQQPFLFKTAYQWMQPSVNEKFYPVIFLIIVLDYAAHVIVVSGTKLNTVNQVHGGQLFSKSFPKIFAGWCLVYPIHEQQLHAIMLITANDFWNGYYTAGSNRL